MLTVIPEVRLDQDGRRLAPDALVVLDPGGARRFSLRGLRPAGRRIPPGVSAPAVGDAPTDAPDGVAESLIVVGLTSPGEDPRVAAVFGLAEPIPGGVRIPLCRVDATPSMASGRRSPLGAVKVTDGTLRVQRAPRRRLRGRRMGLVVLVCCAVGWWIWRARLG